MTDPDQDAVETTEAVEESADEAAEDVAESDPGAE